MSQTLAAALLIAAWLLVAGLALAWWRHERRRRQRVAAAMHELRRPLQALLLSETLAGGERSRLGPIDLAIAALARLEVEAGSQSGPRRGPAPSPCPSWRQLLADAADRWQQAAWLCGRSIALEPELTAAGIPSPISAVADWTPPPEDVLSLAEALDNLILNALLHGRGEVRLGLRRGGGRVELVVRDGSEPPAGGLAAGARSAAARRGPTVPARHGHGLRVVDEIASALGGSFRLDRRGDGSAAVLALPECRFAS